MTQYATWASYSRRHHRRDRSTDDLRRHRAHGRRVIATGRA